MNLSQQKRERMLKFLNDLKEKNKSNVDVIKEINEIETELTSKKYGLVWEEHEENINVMMKDNIPVFTEKKDKEIKTNNSSFSFILEGDNLHSLNLLYKTHKNKIDIIYIDPPYNKGEDFTYEDRRIQKTDNYLHSKWISFIYERISLAKYLLKDKGVIFVSIDDDEYANLKLVLDKIFDETNYIDTIVWHKTENIKMDSDFLSKNKDYVLVYRKTDKTKSFSKQQSGIERFKYEDDKGRYYLRKLDSKSSSYSRGMDYIIEHNGVSYYPGGGYEQYVERQNTPAKRKAPTWLWSKEKYEQGLKDGEIVFKDGNVYNKVRYDGKEKKPYINIQKLVSQQTAQKDLDSIFGERVFDHPKPVQLIKWLIKLYKENKNATVLDFFAGSGTTGNAIIELNEEDKGNRKFILCTNNENNICENVTYPRLKCLYTSKIINNDDYTKEDKDILYEEELTVTNVKDSKEIFSKISDVKTEVGDTYDSIKTEIKDSKIILYGIKKRLVKCDFNLKYYKTDFIPKSVENLDIELDKHTKELVQLENAIDIDDKTVLIALDNDDLAKQLDAIKDTKIISKLYISRFVMLNSKQKKLLKNAHIEVIPDYYFKKELKEKGLNWR